MVALALLTFACELTPPKARPSFSFEADPCADPLITLVVWRDTLGFELATGKQKLTPEALAVLEAAKVAETVEQLRPVAAQCRMAFNLGLFNTPVTPTDRLREEALLTVLDQPAHSYTAEQLGHAGRPVRSPAASAP